uniref:Ig-like domain-containing protein n=1 Tax=Neogobius melanostomus TaxID=47308 RepID=A0A8C6UAV3_9GOBI
MLWFLISSAIYYFIFTLYLFCSEDVTKREGETVVLHVNEPQKTIDYLWTYGSHSPTRALAVVTNGDVIVSNETRFTSRIRLDISSGSMTISNLTIGDSGKFLMQTLTGTERHFNLTVTGILSTPHLSTVENSPSPWICRVNCSVLNSDDVVLSWYRGNTVLSNSSDADVSSRLVLTLDVPQNSREDTFTCEAANPISKRTVVFNTTYDISVQKSAVLGTAKILRRTLKLPGLW